LIIYTVLLQCDTVLA